ncbi:MAG: hypothetical protein U5R06_03905 [candidate division KSB1 bacterium]|nr:hypothetical protein [candidate division KSB1 bacterium]
MDFYISNKRLNGHDERIGDLYLSYEKYHQINERELVHDSDEILIFADANLSFVNSISKEPSIAKVEANIHKLKNGYIAIVNKERREAIIYNDVFGIYPLYYLKSNKSIIISSCFQWIKSFSMESTDDFAILDIILFNYTLMDRTLLSEIKRLLAGSKVKIDSYKLFISVDNNFAENFHYQESKYKISRDVFVDLLNESLANEIAEKREINLTMTAGFDSRELLALCMNQNLKVDTFTFGQAGNIEQETIKSFIHNFSNKHTLFELDEKYIANISNILREFIAANLANPTLLDLPHYMHIRNLQKGSNLITGFMGGEMMQGQSLGSQVTITKLAVELLFAESEKVASSILIDTIGSIGFLNQKYVQSIAREYIETVSKYFYRDDKRNILTFLVNEKFAKFFGTVNNVYKNHSNLIVPFMNPEFLEYVLNSNISFLRKRNFNKNPIANFRSKIFYAKSIKYLCPALANTRFDRLYCVDDLCKYYLIPKAAYYYVQNHLFHKNKRMFPRPHHYDLWYKPIILQELNSKHINEISEIITVDSNFTSNQYDGLMPAEKKKSANLAGINLALGLLTQTKATDEKNICAHGL